MKTDLYTKAVLTVIALALSAIALQHSLSPAYAQPAFPRPELKFTSNGALLVAIDGLRFSSNGLLPVVICDRNLRNNQLWCADVDKLERQ